MKKVTILLLVGLFLIVPLNSAEIKITIPDHRIGDIQDAVASVYKYEAIIDGNPNPETKAEFTNRILKKFLKDVYVTYKIKAIATTKASLINQANNNFTGIQVEPVE
jgi:hypothetical protein